MLISEFVQLTLAKQVFIIQSLCPPDIYIILQILCYSYSELPGNVEIYVRFFFKNSASIGGAEDDGCASHVLDDLFFFGASG